MPIRIYALAKDLKIDSKELVEICARAGISGKGSALASLDDAELAKVKSFLSGGSGSPHQASAEARSTASASANAPAEPKAFTRDDYIGPRTSGRVRVLTRKPKPVPVREAEPPEPVELPADEHEGAPSAEQPTSLEPVAEESVATEPSSPEPDAIETTSPEPVAKPPVSTDPDALEPMRREPVLGRPFARRPLGIKSPAKDSAAKQPPKEKVRRRRAPVIKVTKMPEVKQPTPKPKANEPKPQEPEIRLPKDAIAGARKPLEHLAKSAKSKSKIKGKAGVEGAEQGAVADGAASASKWGTRRGRGAPAAPEGGATGLAGMASARAERRKARKTRTRPGGSERGDEGGATPTRSRRRRTLSRKGTNTAAPRKGKVVLTLPCTVRSFSEAAGVPSAQIQRTLMAMGVMCTINERVDEEHVDLLAGELGVELEFKQQETLEASLITKLNEQEDAPESLEPRPPVVTFLGHVDHGKTSLLDTIIGTDVVAGEAGGITQHIRAYQIEKSGRRISFVDTPGHEAFTEMRARGANVTDIAVLVVAADDGIMPQTEEAISHAKAANVPIVVALNKMDLPGADANRVMTQMTEHGLTPSEWGGETEVVPTSAITGDGIDNLLDTLLTLADLHEYSANPNRAALGTCLEAEQEQGRGVVAKMIVQNGTLRVGDVVVCGDAFGRVKAMYDTLRTTSRRDEATPSMPVNLTGLDTAPEAGQAFYVLNDIAQAREIAGKRAVRSRELSLAGQTIKVSFEEFQRRLQEGRLGEVTEVVTLNLIIRADVRGSIEAIQKELSKLEHPEVQIKIMQASVGGVTTADVALAYASQAVIIGFNVIPDEAARLLADVRDVEIRRYEVIYKVSEDIKSMLEGKLKPEERVVEMGRAVVKQVFPISRIGAVAGCFVLQGSIERNCRIRVNRDGRTIGDYPLESLRREKEDVREVGRGMECGLKLAGFNDVKKDDLLESFKIEEVARTL